MGRGGLGAIGAGGTPTEEYWILKLGRSESEILPRNCRRTNAAATLLLPSLWEESSAATQGSVSAGKPGAANSIACHHSSTDHGCSQDPRAAPAHLLKIVNRQVHITDCVIAMRCSMAFVDAAGAETTCYGLSQCHCDVARFDILSLSLSARDLIYALAGLAEKRTCSTKTPDA